MIQIYFIDCNKTPYLFHMKFIKKEESESFHNNQNHKLQKLKFGDKLNVMTKVIKYEIEQTET